MKIKTLDSNKSLLFLGDIHGSWYHLLNMIDEAKINNANVICVGDIGVGFKKSIKDEYFYFNQLNETFKAANINFFGIRGNHDNPLFFCKKNRVCLDNFELLEDYSVLQYDSKLIQCIGGAISLDRTIRKEGQSYWSDEPACFKKTKCKKTDILVTHTAPSRCFPQKFNDFVFSWAKHDNLLLDDLIAERVLLDKIFAQCNPTIHLYGHFHSSKTEIIDGCKHKLLDVNEIWQLQ